jgi:glycosyltransferase involved in cell wall biosynthesis
VLDAVQDTRLRVIHLKKNVGRSTARNRAAQAARGDYLAMLDADDVAYPERLERQLDFLESHPQIALCGAWAHLVEPSGKKQEWRPSCEPAAVRRALLRSNPFIHCTIIVRREVFEEARGFDEALDASEDYDLYLRIAAKHDAANIPFILAAYSAHDGLRYRIKELWHQSRIRARAIGRYGYPKREIFFVLLPWAALFIPRAWKMYLKRRFSQL